MTEERSSESTTTMNPTQTDCEAATPSPNSSSRRSIAARGGRSRLYRHANSSSTSIDSTTFLDHRHQAMSLTRNVLDIPHTTSTSHAKRRRHQTKQKPDGDYPSDATSDHDEEQEEEDEETMRMLAGGSVHRQSFAPWTKPRRMSIDESNESTRLLGSQERLDSMYGTRSETWAGTSPPRQGRLSIFSRQNPNKRYDYVNHPNSMPSSVGSPPRTRQMSIVGTGADGQQLAMPLAQRAQRRLTQEFPRTRGDVLIDIESGEGTSADLSALPPVSISPGHGSIHSTTESVHSRRKKYNPEEDVCFPTEEPSPKSAWPDFEVLEEWAAQEGKSLDEGSAAVRDGEGGFLGHRKVSEPVMVDGRYRRGYTFPAVLSREVFPFLFS